MAAIQLMPKLISTRGSNLPTMRPTMGENTMASTPPKAVARPAQVAV